MASRTARPFLFIALAALLAPACDKPTPLDPTELLDEPAMTTDQLLPVFIEEPAPIVVPTYDGTGEAVHPDVVEFPSAWNGSRYWMSMTPYAHSDQSLENPSILRSDDGLSLSIPAGLRNPVISRPDKSKDYNSDPELVYEPATNRLILFYRTVSSSGNTILYTTSRNGVTWSRSKLAMLAPSHRAVSPTISTGGASAPTRLWYVDTGKDGCKATSSQVMMRAASDLSGRVLDVTWRPEVKTDLNIPGYVVWHVKARYVPSKGEYWMLLSAFPLKGRGCLVDDLFFARSTDGVHWTTYTQPLLRHEDRAWTAAAVYRSTFTYDQDTDEMRLWISARGRDGKWQMGHARLRYESLLDKLTSGESVTPPPAHAFRAPQLGDAGESP